MKANSALKSRKFLGMCAQPQYYMLIVLTLFIPYRPGFVSRLKEKGAVAKEAWGVLGSA